MQKAAIPPIRKGIEVATTPDRAFRIFTSDMHRWWPSCEGDALERETVVLEPRVGGRWLERTKSGAERQFGHVLAWDPPGRVVLAWQVGLDQKFDPSLVTEVEISFSPAGSGRTLVVVEHSKLERYGVRAESAFNVFDSPDAWIGVLKAFCAAAEAK